MRVLLLLFALLVAGQANATRLIDWFVPTPIGILLKVSEWSEDKDPLLFAQVEATGATEQQALNNAFVLAIQYAVGTLVVSESTVNVTRADKQILDYSSGFVDQFKVTKQTTTVDGVKLTVDVWVRKSRINERVMHVSKKSSQISGNQFSATIDSLVTEENKGDRLVKNYLRDYPGRSYYIDLESAGLVYQDRQPVLKLQWTTEWQHEYLQGLLETVSSVAHGGTSEVIYKKNRHHNGYRYAMDHARFLDFNIADSVYVIEVKDRQGSALNTYCENFADSAFIQSYYGNKLIINSWQTKEEIVYLPLTDVDTRRIASYSVEIARSCN